MADELDELDELSRGLIIKGYPMTDLSKIIAALVIRLGGDVNLTPTEYKAAEGLVIWKDGEGIRIEANTDPAFTVLDSSVIE